MHFCCTPQDLRSSTPKAAPRTAFRKKQLEPEEAAAQARACCCGCSGGFAPAVSLTLHTVTLYHPPASARPACGTLLYKLLLACTCCQCTRQQCPQFQ